MEFKYLIEILVGLTALISFTYRIYQLESKIYRNIDSIEDKFTKWFNDLNNDLAVHLTNYEARKEMQDYLINALNEKIDHKFQRCWEEIKNKSD